MTKKRLQQTMALIYSIYGQERTAEIADDLKDMGFYYATVSGISMGMGDFERIEGMDGAIEGGESRSAAISEQYEEGFITDEERHRLTVENWTSIETKAQDLLTQQMVGQAYLLSSIELFWICGWLSFAMIGLVWLASRPTAHGGPIAAD